MGRFLVALGALALGALLIPSEAAAQRGFGFRGGGAAVGRVPWAPPSGGFRGGMAGPIGGFRGGSAVSAGGGIGGFRGGAIGMQRGFRSAAIATRPGLDYGYRPRVGYRPGFGNYRPYYRSRYPYYGRYYASRYPHYGWDYPYYDDWGWGLGGLALGAVIGAAVASPYPVYETPISSAIGGYCATPVRTCALTNPAQVGIGCSCRTASGRARGTVVAEP
jgi:hypothetical protein